MTRKEPETWLQTDDSKFVGQGEGEPKGHGSGRRILVSWRRISRTTPTTTSTT